MQKLGFFLLFAKKKAASSNHKSHKSMQYTYLLFRQIAIPTLGVCCLLFGLGQVWCPLQQQHQQQEQEHEQQQQLFRT
jgi:hypothetical protein